MQINTRKFGPVHLGIWYPGYRNMMDVMLFVGLERISRCREEYLDHSAVAIESFAYFLQRKYTNIAAFYNQNV